MPSRKDSTSRRLFKLFDQATWRHAEQITIDMLARTGTKLVFNFADDTVHAALSREALRLDKSNEADTAVFAAFELAGLNPQNPLHWGALVRMFSEAHFGKARTKPQKWSPVALNELFADYRTIKRENPGARDPKIRQLLRSDRRFKHKYRHYSVERFRKLVRDASDPKTNVFLRHPEMNDPDLQLLRAKHEQCGFQWTPESEMDAKEVIQRFSKKSGP